MSKILGFHISELDQSVFKNGFCSPSDLNLESIQTEYIERKPFAEDPANEYVHFIPYIVLQDTDSSKIFKYERSNKGGEARLHSMCSVGVGGHVDLDETLLGELNYLVILETAVKELEEELNIDSYIEDFELVGYIYDNTDEVGKVHLGVILSLDCDHFVHNDPLRGGEEDIVVGREWVELSDLKEGKYNLENWSKIAVSNL